MIPSSFILQQRQKHPDSVLLYRLDSSVKKPVYIAIDANDVLLLHSIGYSATLKGDNNIFDACRILISKNYEVKLITPELDVYGKYQCSKH